MKFKPSSFYSKIIIVFALIFDLFISAIPNTSIQAETLITVNTFEDLAKNDGMCSLREAVISANTDTASGKKKNECPAGNGSDTIVLPAGTYLITNSDAGNEDSSQTGDLDILSDITIQGEGADVTFIDASAVKQERNRIIHIISGNVTLSGITLLAGNVGGDGGAIHNSGTLFVDQTHITNSTASDRGGAVFNEGTLTVQNSTMDNNSAAIQGGGVFNAGTAEFINVTMSQNFVDSSGKGGGISNESGNINLLNVTIAENGFNTQTGSGANLFNFEGSITLYNTILADPISGENCSGPVASLDHNLSSDNSCALFLDQPFDQNDVDPLLGELSNNGGKTPTKILLAGSPALDTGDSSNCPDTDQRGFPRPLGSACDIGAVEMPFFDSWITAQRIYPGQSIYQYIETANQSRWFKFEVEPGSRVIVTLTELPSNYDLTLYKDIADAFNDLATSEDLNRLGAEFAPDAFSPDAFSPDAFSPDAFSPDAFSPDAFSPDAFSPDAYSPDAFSPDAFSPDAFSPDAFSPDAFSPDAYSPDAFSPDAYSPDAYSPDAFSPDAYSGAQTRSLIAVSAFDGTAGEGVVVNTWDNEGDFFVRVRGRNGVYSLDDPFRLDVHLIPGTCTGVSADILPPSNLSASSGGFNTIILTDFSRLDFSEVSQADFESLLVDFAAQVNGVVVDVGQDNRVNAAKSQADSFPTCPYAKNLLADSIKNIIQDYQSKNPLEYIVLLGNDDVIPFFRHPDQALLANEKNYIPPVLDNTASQASLKLGYILSQDRYGSTYDISIKTHTLPIPYLAVGRVVEDPKDITAVINAFISGTNNGVIATTDSALVTGYDFLEDAALAVQQELAGGMNIPTTDELISPSWMAPQDENAWTAEQLREKLLNNRYDMIFLAGHFSASSALAADYETRLLTTDVLNSQVDLLNTIVFSAGCHAGYNIVDNHGVPNVTREPDWAQAFAQKGATLIAGTGYQYGDTDFIEYSERLYLGFSRQLRYGSGPVSLGKALVNAKQEYLAGTPNMRGIHEKAFLEATLFGLPMLSVDFPASGRLPEPTDSPIVSSTTAFTSNPGQFLGLQYADVNLLPNVSQVDVPLTDPLDRSIVLDTATYFIGSDGVIINPSEPIYPVETYDVSVPNFAVKGVGFRGGTYQDLFDVLPLTDAATTEIRGVHTPFLSEVYYPVIPWHINYFDTLTGEVNGSAYLTWIPAQFQSNVDDYVYGTMRKYIEGNFRLYYSDNVETYNDNSTPALSAAPDITHISAVPDPDNDQVDFQIQVLGNPSAGIQEVWVTYTALSGGYYGTFQPLDLVQNPLDSSIWEGSLALNGIPAEDIRYLVQAVNGVGLVGISTNLGVSYIPGYDPAQKENTELVLELSESSAPYGSQTVFNAVLTTNGSPLAGEIIKFRLGTQYAQATTDGNGRASVVVPLLGLPGIQEVKATFSGDMIYAGSTTSAPFTITKQSTNLTLSPQPASGFPGSASLVIATLRDATGRTLAEKTVFFVISGGGESYSEALITDYAGRAILGELPLAPGVYAIDAYFSGTVPLSTATLNLDDERYQPSNTAGTLILIDTPTAVDDTFSTDEDTQLIVQTPGVLLNDSNWPGIELQTALVGSTSNGILNLNADGSFVYTPDLNYTGLDTFTYQVLLDNIVSNSATVTITVNPADDAPVASDDFYDGDEDTPLTIAAPGILHNDTDAENDLLTSSLVDNPQFGTVQLNLDGSFTYTPTLDFAGIDLFSYQAVDGALTSNVASVQISVQEINDNPICTNAYANLDTIWPANNKFHTVEILGISDPEDDSVNATITSVFQDEPVGNNPDAVLNGNTVDLRGERDGNGDGRVYHLSFTADDSRGGNCSGELRLAVIPHDNSNDIDVIDGGPLYDSTITE